MPLTVNVGISRKASANYQSQGLSINLTAELDQSLLADPPGCSWRSTAPTPRPSSRWTRRGKP